METTSTAPQSFVSASPIESPIQEIIKFILKNSLSNQPELSFSETCRIMKTILQNILKNPQQEKFRIVKINSPKFLQFVAEHKFALIILEMLGFQQVQDSDPLLICTLDDPSVFSSILPVLDKFITPQFISPEPYQPPKSTRKPPKLRSQKEQDLESQLKDYRNKQQNRDPQNCKVWTAEEIEQFRGPEERKIQINERNRNSEKEILQDPRRMVQFYNDVSSFKDPRNLVLRAFELVFFSQSNEFRISQGKKPLIWSEGLSVIAYGHSRDMGEGLVKFGHDGFNRRFKRFPFLFVRGGAENVAYNYGHADPSKVCVEGWIESPGHRKNLLGLFDYMGIGMYLNSSGYYYYTQLFALT